MKPLLVILGPTASGKTNLATKVCSQIGGELISADSRQVYRGMNIGTGKDLHEFTTEGKTIPYHLIDILDAGEQYNVNEFQKDFIRVHQSIQQRNAVPVVCGGTGFYIHSLLKGHAFGSIPVNENLRESLELFSKEELAERFSKTISGYNDLADTSTRKRLIRAIEISEYLIAHPDETAERFGSNPGYNAIIYGLNLALETRRDRITTRLKSRLENGLIEEVEELLAKGLSAEQLIYYGLEYKFVTMYLQGELSLEEMSSKLETEIHRFAKRQMTFFRKMEKDGLVINWLDENLSVDQKAKHIVADYQGKCSSEI
ncbi:tRNA (adenosine(37)-N6)-dimethylallyltransferase MiaA [Dyadobacter psychrotolerans]|uniref:tRNA dimethylallyltransferase n=1 Tax=Dyadobacter psychrotolerans TaxID=2541721 RepID=A0A4R5DWL8_9BACT|nr:tRNA (adenosine(37)-N6)-dimethylallyltransferase MiaA [Dyadobacter psychrotolerans]TDE15685.1 tRNA (adenosine(37)-N6)-dimethylallyltransferase MiaA [Dyadobacter psychrotolerans]